MVRKLRIGLVAVLAAGVFIPTGAGAATRNVTGTMTGTGGFRFQSCPGVVSVISTGTYAASGMGTGTYRLDICVLNTSDLSVQGTVVFTTKRGATLSGTIGGSIPGGPATTPYAVTVTGGTLRFRRAGGTLFLGPLLESDFRNCDPRVGICLDWTDTGPISGTLFHVHR